MATFKGYGPGKKGGWKSRTYRADGSVVDDGKAGARTSSTRSEKGFRFKPYVDFGMTAEAAKRHGMKRTANKGTIVETERQLNNYLAAERDHGRDVGWKDW